jgi:hypothetical protein
MEPSLRRERHRQREPQARGSAVAVVDSQVQQRAVVKSVPRGTRP